VDDEHLANYLLPRECPRVCWVPTADSTSFLDSPASRVIAIEHRWLPALTDAGLQVHELDPSGFTCLDEIAGYWVADEEVAVLGVRTVNDCSAALAERGVELRVTTSLWPYVDAVVATGGQFSVIRTRNAAARS
jgi:hypothetical protein